MRSVRNRLIAAEAAPTCRRHFARAGCDYSNAKDPPSNCVAAPLLLSDHCGYFRHHSTVLPNIGSYRRIFAQEFQAFGHLLFFAILSEIALQLRLLTRHLYPPSAAIVLTGALLLGRMVELVQPYFGCSAAIKDAWRKVSRASIAVALSAYRGFVNRAATATS